MSSQAGDDTIHPMPDTVDFFIRIFFLGGIFTTSIYCFVTWLSRGRDKLFLGYALFTFSSALLVFFRRIYPLFTPGNGNPFSEIMSVIFIHCIAGSGLYYFLIFLKVPRHSGFYRFFVIAYAVLSAIMVAAQALHFGLGRIWPPIIYYVAVGLFTITGLLYLIRVIRRREITFRLEKRLLFYFGAVLLFLLILSFLTAFIPVPPFSLLLPVLYCFLLFFFFLHGVRLNADYRELAALKTDLEQKVKDRTDEITELHRKKQRFFITFTHETKTPLTLISSCLERYMASSPPHPDLDIIRRNLAKLRGDMINYLDYEKLLTDYELFNHDRTTDVSWLLREKIILFRPLAEKKGITLREKLVEGITASADPAALDKIINNLLDNAVKYTPAGGKIEAALAKKGKTVLLSVRDTGIGISRDQQDHIFDPFFQVARKTGDIQGVGMGLSIVRQIVQGLNGKITLKSDAAKAAADQRGRSWVTEVTVVVPRCAPVSTKTVGTGSAFSITRPPESFTPVRGPVAPHDGGKPTLFFVEDNPELLYFLLSGLEDHFNVYGERNGAEALNRIDTLPKPDIIISDIMMDVMDGYEFFARLKERSRYHDVPFIFLTAVSSSLEKIKSLSKGAIDFITKPLSGLAELEAKISSLLEFVNRKTTLVKNDLFDKLRRVMADEQKHLSGQDDLLQQNMAAFGLTDREQGIIACLRAGLQNKEISAKLGTSTRTIDNHLYNIYRKTGSQNRMDLLNKLLSPR